MNKRLKVGQIAVVVDYACGNKIGTIVKILKYCGPRNDKDGHHMYQVNSGETPNFDEVNLVPATKAEKLKWLKK